MRKAFAILILILVSMPLLPAAAQSPDAQKIYTHLYCPLCGGVRLDACELQVCSEMKVEIQQKLAAGESEQQIIQYYRVRWGDQVLGYPPAEGLNIVPWLLPVAMVGLSGFALWRMAAGWARRRASGAPVAAAEGVPDELAARIERELYE
jgi:cytochrome c-type biogenesis protein CcmH